MPAQRGRTVLHRPGLRSPADDTVLDVCETIHGASVGGFTFELAATRGDGRHWALTARHPDLGQPAAFACSNRICSYPSFSAEELQANVQQMAKLKPSRASLN